MKSNLNQIEKKFLHKALDNGSKGTILFPKQTAIDFIEECRKKKVPVFGLDGFCVGKDIKPIKGFRVTEESIQPSLGDSIDLSRSPYEYIDFTLDEIYDKSIEFIRERPESLYFEIVCGGEE